MTIICTDKTLKSKASVLEALASDKDFRVSMTYQHINLADIKKYANEESISIRYSSSRKQIWLPANAIAELAVSSDIKSFIKKWSL